MVGALKHLLDHPILAALRSHSVNSAWLIAEQFLRLAAGIAIGTWVARHLGPAQYGALAYFLSFVALAAALARVGLDALAVHLMVAQPERRVLILGTVFRLKLLGSVVAVVLITLAAVMLAESASDALYIAVIACGLLFQSVDVIDFWFQSRAEARVSALARIIQLLLSSLAKMGLILAGAQLAAFAMMAVVDQLLLAAVFWAFYRFRKHSSFFAEYDPALAKAILRQAAPLILSGVLVTVYTRLDQVILRHLAGVGAVGWYAAAVVVTEALFAFPIAVATALFPSIVTSYATAKSDYRRQVVFLGRALLVWGLATSSIISASAPAIVDLLYGSAYSTSASVLSIYVWILPLICYSAVLGKTLVTEGRMRLLPRLTALAMAIHVPGLFLLVPAYGVTGAAVTAMLAQAFPVVVLLSVDAESRGRFLAMIGAAPANAGQP